MNNKIVRLIGLALGLWLCTNVANAFVSEGFSWENGYGSHSKMDLHITQAREKSVKNAVLECSSDVKRLTEFVDVVDSDLLWISVKSRADYECIDESTL